MTKEKTEESAWLINRDTILYVLIAERKKGQFKAYGPFLLSHILIAGDNIFLGGGGGGTVLLGITIRSWVTYSTTPEDWSDISSCAWEMENGGQCGKLFSRT